jgi:hypothetical protein
LGDGVATEIQAQRGLDVARRSVGKGDCHGYADECNAALSTGLARYD